MIYLDNASTTKMDRRVFDAMMPYMVECYGNPGSVHNLGQRSKDAIERARCQVAKMIGAKPENIIFTSGGSESNTTVFRGVHDFVLDNDLYTVATSNAEHKSVIKSAESVFRRDEIPVNHDGSVSLESVVEVCESDDNLALVSVMHTNNETGSVSDVAKIAKYCRERGILFHTDCVQAAGFHDLSVDEIGCDFMSISSHKIHGPKGMGALYVRDPNILSPVIFGGTGQEFGLRGGTENVPGIVGFGAACDLVCSNIKQDREKMAFMTRMLLDELEKITDENDNKLVVIHGQENTDRRILNASFKGYDGETLLMMLNLLGVAVSAGAACNSKETIASYVLKSMGISDEEAMSSLRFSVSRFTTKEEIETACRIITECLRSIAK